MASWRSFGFGMAKSFSRILPALCVVFSGRESNDVVGLNMISNAVKHPSHYTSHPSGVECIRIVEHFNFNIGNAIKYLWRVDLKDDPIENLEKAMNSTRLEIKRRKRMRRKIMLADQKKMLAANEATQ